LICRHEEVGNSSASPLSSRKQLKMYSKAFLILSSVWAFGLAQTASAAEYPFLSTLSVNIQQIDSTSVNITFSNHDDKKISLFTQNTLFDDAAANSFIVTHKVDGKEIKLGGGECDVNSDQAITC
jgi:hypothetical protein